MSRAVALQGVRENEVLTLRASSARCTLGDETKYYIKQIPQVAQKTTLRTRESAARGPPGQRSQFSWNIRSLAAGPVCTVTLDVSASS
jgi:hypothetical protein